MFKLFVYSALIAGALGAAIPDGLLPQSDERIVGGADTTINKHPYIVSIQKSGSHTCGGSLYSTTVVVTAAHCLQVVNLSGLKIRAGSTKSDSGGILVGVASFTNNPKFDLYTLANDIAVIKLDTALTLGSNIQTINLVSTAPVDGTPATVIGWGNLNYGETTLPTTLQAVDVVIISRKVCTSAPYSYYETEVLSSMICAAAPEKDACQGDSGGPLTTSEGLVGVVSWGYRCANARFPGVYANVAVLRSWVVSAAA